MLFSMYVPTLRAEPAEKDKFYSELRSTSVDDKVIILSDFNAKVGQDAESCKGVLGRHGVGNCNGNGRLLLEQQVVLTNTVFQQKDRLKTNWMPPRFKHWHQIDYVLVHKGDLKDFIHTKAMPSAECHTDHCLVRCKLKLQFKPKPKKKGDLRKKKFNLNKLQSAEVKADFQAGLQPKFENSDGSEDTSETRWDQLKSAILQTSEEVLGFTTKKYKDWFDENNQEI